jgi:hypothetical protein
LERPVPFVAEQVSVTPAVSPARPWFRIRRRTRCWIPDR